MSVINTNVASLNAQAALAANARSLGKAMEQLSTGRRINSASDDAAGLAVSTRLTSQIRGLNQAVRNANDGISMIQTAEGAAVEITNMLQRMRELAVQSANDTNTANDRGFLNLEYQQLYGEIKRIAGTTQWNGMNILDGTVNSGKFIYQVGANSNQTVDITIGDFRDTDGPSRTLTATKGSEVTKDTNIKQQTPYTLDGNYVAGDVISITVTGPAGAETKSYTVVDEDVASSTKATNLAAIATKIKNTLTFTDVNVTSSSADVILEAKANNTAFTNSVVINQYKGNGGGQVFDIKGTDITTRSNANLSISAIDKSLTNINTQRATMGAVVNRLQYTVDNLTNVSTKASESRSRVLDTDYSQATTELSKRQIISQAATAMLAQANQQPQTVLSLLK